MLHTRLVEKIGEGGMGVLWKAVDTNFDRELAVKLLPPEFAERPERVQRFEQEAQTMGALNHPNIVTPAVKPGLQTIALESTCRL